VSDYHEGDYTQIWSYTNGTGFLKNKGSGWVIEVPSKFTIAVIIY
jgi:hypothetical protein